MNAVPLYPHPQRRLQKVLATKDELSLAVGSGKSPPAERRTQCKGSEAGTIQGNGGI